MNVYIITSLIELNLLAGKPFFAPITNLKQFTVRGDLRPKNLFPDGESNPGRGGESAES